LLVGLGCHSKEAGDEGDLPSDVSFSMTNPPMQMVVTAQDQQLGGLLMWIVGSIYFIVLASIFFLRWMLQQEKMQQAKEVERDQEMLAALTSETHSDDD
jgi:cytochrome c oxidase assembly factor CtaG